jgi:hypothetical protein
MSLTIRAKHCLHLLTLVWVITWVTTVPLFHTHLPDVSDGLAGRHGLAHTVFSPDLPGEFSCTHSNVLHLSTKAQNSPELGFVTSIDSKDTTFEELCALYIIPCCVSERPVLAALVVDSHDPPPKTDRSRAAQSARAPPVIVSRPF